MRKGVLIAGLLACQLSQDQAASAKATSFGLPQDITRPSAGGFEIPLYGEREEITRLFRAPDGHLVLAFDYGPLHGIKSDLYDTVTRQRAYPQQEQQAANDNSIEANYVRTHQLVMLYPSVGPSPSGRQIHGTYEGGRICGNNPYFLYFRIDQDFDSGFQIFQKLAAPKSVTLTPDCGNRAPVTYRYSDRHSADVYGNDAGFFLGIDHFLIWFDWNGHTDFLNGRDDYVVVPAAALARVYQEDKKDDGEAYSPGTILRADAIIAQYGARQLKAKRHV